MTRRKIIWLIAAGFAFVSAGLASFVALPSRLRFFWRPPLPEPLHEPSSKLVVGHPSDFVAGVDTQFLQQNRVYIVRNSDRLYVIYARCTDQGRTPDWITSESKFRCPCHGSRFCIGSAFDGNGLNCAGPAPRPLDRVHVEVNQAGEIVADISRLYEWSKESPSQFDEPGAYISLKIS